MASKPLLLAALLLVVAAAASASVQAQAPAPAPAVDPACPGPLIDRLIVDVLTGKAPAAEAVQVFTARPTFFIADCICGRIVGAAGIDVARATPAAVNRLVIDVVKTLQPILGQYGTVVSACFPEKGRGRNPSGAGA